jgi:hypothetical protein
MAAVCVVDGEICFERKLFVCRVWLAIMLVNGMAIFPQAWKPELPHNRSINAG